MNLQPVAPPRSSANGFNRRRADNKLQAEPLNSNVMATTGIPLWIYCLITFMLILLTFVHSGLPAGEKGGVDGPSRERLVYLTTCLIGHQVEVQVIDGSVFSGIFHATNADSDFGIFQDI